MTPLRSFEKWDVFVVVYGAKTPTLAVITGKYPESYVRIALISGDIRTFACFSVSPTKMKDILQSGLWVRVGSLKQLLDETQC